MVSLFSSYYLYKFTSIDLPTGSVGKVSSQPSNINEEEQRMKTLDKLKRDLQKMKNERDELRENLAHYTNQDLNDR